MKTLARLKPYKTIYVVYYGRGFLYDRFATLKIAKQAGKKQFGEDFKVLRYDLREAK